MQTSMGDQKDSTSTVEALLSQMTAPVPGSPHTTRDKISVVGAGSVGAACAFALITKGIAQELVLIDKDPKLARDELLDMMNASVYLNDPVLTFSDELERTRNSRIVIVTAGQPIVGTEPDIATVIQNVLIYRDIIPDLVDYSPNCILLIASSPVDLMTFMAWKMSDLPSNRVLGTGLALVSARFRKLLAKKLGLSPSSLHAFVVGEFGPRCVPVWSGVSACGIRLREINPLMGLNDDPEQWDDIFKEVLVNCYSVIKSKTTSTWGTAAAVSKIVNAILKDTHDCLSVSTHIKGCRHGVDKNKDVFLSLPCVLGRNGVLQIVRQNLSKDEKALLQESANFMYSFQTQFKF